MLRVSFAFLRCRKFDRPILKNDFSRQSLQILIKIHIQLKRDFSLRNERNNWFWYNKNSGNSESMGVHNCMRMRAFQPCCQKNIDDANVIDFRLNFRRWQRRIQISTTIILQRRFFELCVYIFELFSLKIIKNVKLVIAVFFKQRRPPTLCVSAIFIGSIVR